MSAAEVLEVVIAIYLAVEPGNFWTQGSLLVPIPSINEVVVYERTLVPMANDRVRFVGEPKVMILAESCYLA